MMATSDGSQANAKQFLKGYLDENYAAMQEDIIRQRQREKIPAEGDYALRGMLRDDTKRRYELGILRV